MKKLCTSQGYFFEKRFNPILYEGMWPPDDLFDNVKNCQGPKARALVYFFKFNFSRYLEIVGYLYV